MSKSKTSFEELKRPNLLSTAKHYSMLTLLLQDRH